MSVCIEEAYNIYKLMWPESVVITVMETTEFYAFNKNNRRLICKDNGEIVELSLGDFIFLYEEGKFVYIQRMIDELYAFCNGEKSEKKMASVYAAVWNELIYIQRKDGLYLKCYEEIQNDVLREFMSVEKILHKQIEEILDFDDSVVYPPCVLNKENQYFYKIKPFMVRNGYTDSMNDETWVWA